MTSTWKDFINGIVWFLLTLLKALEGWYPVAIFVTSILAVPYKCDNKRLTLMHRLGKASNSHQNSRDKYACEILVRVSQGLHIRSSLKLTEP